MSESYPYSIYPPQKGQTVLGIVMQACILSGKPSLKEAARYFFGRTAIQPPLIVPSNLEMFASRCPGVFEDAAAIIDDYTVWPACSPFLRSDVRKTVTEHMLRGTLSKSCTSYLGLQGQRANIRMGQLYCEDCVAEHMVTPGIPYWQRMHQVPGLSRCWKHGRMLTSGCGTCVFSELRSRRVRLPGLVCACGKPNVPFYPASARQAQAAEKVVSSIIDELLVVPIPPDFTAEQIIKANLWRIGDLGYCANGKVDIASVRRDLLKKFGEEFLVQVGAPVDELSKWVHRALVRGESVASVSRNAILIAFLFDSVSVLKECLFGREVGEYEHPRRGVYVKYAVTTSPDREKELTYKRLAKTYFSDNPNASRTECELEMPGMVRWLRLHCRAWYERNFPKSRLTLKRERDSTEYHRELDRSLCEHLTRRHAELTKAGLRPRRHTERLLLSGHARGNEYASLKAYLPTSRQLLERLTESQEQYKERLAIWAIRYSEPSDENQLDYAHRLTGLPYYKLAEIVSVDSRIKSASRT